MTSDFTRLQHSAKTVNRSTRTLVHTLPVNMEPVSHELLGSDPKLKQQHSMKNLLMASICSYLGAFSFGYTIGYSSPALPNMEKDGLLSPESAMWFGSLMTFGGMFGCPTAGWLVEKFGRRGALFLTMFPFLLGWVLICFGNGLAVLYLGRFLTGLGGGMVTVASPMYIAETCPKELRGMLGSGVQLNVTLGILLVYALGVVFTWRNLAMVGIVIPIVAIFFAMRSPETPRYYLLRGRKKDALRCLTALRGDGYDVNEECRDIEESLDVDTQFSWSEFKKPELYQPLIVSVGLMVFQQLIGINVVMFYTVSIFRSAGFGEGSEKATLVIGIVQVIVTLVACYLMDRAGRRPLLLIGGMGMAMACIAFGVYYNATEGLSPSQNNLSWLALFSLILYIAAFGLGWGPVPMLVMSEIFPVHARGAASAISTIASWISAFLITNKYGLLLSTFGQGGTFMFFGIWCVVSMAFVWRLVPETKGRSLEDIELYFLGRAIRKI